MELLMDKLEPITPHTCICYFLLGHLLCARVLTLILFVDVGVDLSCIVKAVPAVSSDDKQEEQTHEVLQVSHLLKW